jgi:hypothetical protein
MDSIKGSLAADQPTPMEGGRPVRNEIKLRPRRCSPILRKQKHSVR